MGIAALDGCMVSFWQLLEGKSSSNIFQLLGDFSRRSVQFRGNHLLFSEIQCGEHFTQITINYILKV